MCTWYARLTYTGGHFTDLFSALDGAPMQRMVASQAGVIYALVTSPSGGMLLAAGSGEVLQSLIYSRACARARVIALRAALHLGRYCTAGICRGAQRAP